MNRLNALERLAWGILADDDGEDTVRRLYVFVSLPLAIRYQVNI